MNIGSLIQHKLTNKNGVVLEVLFQGWLIVKWGKSNKPSLIHSDRVLLRKNHPHTEIFT